MVVVQKERTCISQSYQSNLSCAFLYGLSWSAVTSTVQAAHHWFASILETVHQKVWWSNSICVALVQDDKAADSADTEADQVIVNKGGLPHDSGRQEGVTPSDPSFSRPAPCLLPEHHQAWACYPLVNRQLLFLCKHCSSLLMLTSSTIHLVHLKCIGVVLYVLLIIPTIQTTVRAPTLLSAM